jgi:aminoglycoside phosphotransferase (APT) family kinase protein
VGVGDPACDLAIAWTMFSGQSRTAFRDRLAVTPQTWARGRGWALWKALAGYAGDVLSGHPQSSEARDVLEQIFTDYQHST